MAATGRCALVALVLLAGCKSGAEFLATPGTTTGVVTINSAQVYSRERLLNDRNREVAWLRSVLANSDLEAFGFQGSSDIRSFEALLTQVRATTDVTKGAVPRPGLTESDDATSSFGTPAGTDLSSEILDETTPKLPSTDPDAASSSASPIDEFRDRVAYREEIRAQLIETQLDDRHDLDGKTLYRLQFSPTVIPGHDTDSWALLKVRVNPPRTVNDLWFERLYNRWASYQREKINTEMASLVEAIAAGKVNSRNGFELVHFFASRAEKECAAAGRPGPPPFLFGQLPTRQLKMMQQYEAGRSLGQSLVAESINGIVETWAECRRDLELFPNVKEAKDLRSGIIAGTVANYVLLKAEERFGKYLVFSNTCADSAGGNCRILVNERPRDMTSVEAKLDVCTLAKRVECTRVPQSLEEADAEQFGMLLSEFRSKLKSVYAPEPRNAGDISVYAVTPKETVQRISDVGGRREAAQEVMQLSALLGAVSLDAAMTHLRDSQLLLHAIHRQPLVVGFTDRHQVYIPPDQPPTDGGAAPSVPRTRVEMGWLLGPTFKLVKDGTGTFGSTEVQYAFRHLNRQNSLAAAIAVPSWWPSVELQVAGCWRSSVAGGLDDCNDVAGVIETALRRDAVRAADGAVFPAAVRTLRVELPVDVTELDRILHDEVTGPQPQFADMIPDLVVGEPGRVLLLGDNLWRNAVVTVGSQASDKVTILPDMRGIIAEFARVFPPAGWGSDDEAVGQPVRVWTSEGQSFVGIATLHGAGGASPRVAIATTPLIKAQKVVLDVSRQVVPTNFHSVQLAYRRYDARGIGNWQLLDAAAVDSNAGTVSADKLAKVCTGCGNGVIVEAAVVVTPRAAAVPEYHKSLNRAVYYDNATAAAVQLLQDGKTDVPGDVTVALADVSGGKRKLIRFVYPANDAAAFTDFERQAASFRAKGANSSYLRIGSPGKCQTLPAGSAFPGQYVCDVLIGVDDSRTAAVFGGGNSVSFGFELTGKGQAPAVLHSLTVTK